MRPFDFAGCYESWPAATSESNPFDTIQWLDTVEVYLQSLLDAEFADRLAIEHYIVPVCTLAAEAAARRGEVQVLDFGGGVGVIFVNVRAALPVATKLHYSIVYFLANRDRWQRLFKAPMNCEFFTEVTRRRNYDVVFASSTLQYISELGRGVDQTCGCLRALDRPAAAAYHEGLCVCDASEYKVLQWASFRRNGWNNPALVLQQRGNNRGIAGAWLRADPRSFHQRLWRTRRQYFPSAG